MRSTDRYVDSFVDHRPKKLSEREQRQLNLEKMKTRREKKTTTTQLTESSAESEQSAEEDWKTIEIRKTLLDGDNYDEDFVDDQGSDTLGAPELAQIPIEFTRHAHKSLRSYFTNVVEWLVHNKLNPAFPRDDPIYTLAFQKINDEVKGYANSKLISSTWVADYVRALRARPVYTEVEDKVAGLERHCQACNRSGHQASFKISLTGKAYDTESLEALKEADDSNATEDSDDETDDGSVDNQGNTLPEETREYWLGTFCKANSARAHALLHWKWHLNDWILGWLEAAGYTSAEQIVAREKWSVKRRSKYANRVVDEMDEQEIQKLWRDFKTQIAEARAQKVYNGLLALLN